MALASSSPFASFDITDGSQIRDISPVLADAIYYDLHLLGAMNVDFGSPVYDTTHYWNEDALNSDTVTTSIAWVSDSTAVSVTAGQGPRVHVGDLLVNMTTATQEVKQVTAISGDGLTVVPGYNGTTTVTTSAGDTFGIIRAEQEGSDIGSDKSVAPLVKQNSTQIFAGAFDILVSGSQLARKMATNQMQDQDVVLLKFDYMLEHPKAPHTDNVKIEEMDNGRSAGKITGASLRRRTHLRGRMLYRFSSN